MKSTRLGIWVILIVLYFLFIGFAWSDMDGKPDQQNAAAPPLSLTTASSDFKINGRVVDATPDISPENLARFDSANSMREAEDSLKRMVLERPAPGVVVVLRSGAMTRETTTDSEGGFTFSGVPAESCELSVMGLNAPSSWEGDSKVVTAKRAMSCYEVKKGRFVKMECRADYVTVSGHITNTAQKPLAGVKVTGVCVAKSIDQYSWVEVSEKYSTVSDSNGNYEFAGLTPENVYKIAGAGDTGGLRHLEIRTEADGFKPGMVRVPLVSEDLLKPARRLYKSLEQLYLKTEGKGKSVPKRPELTIPSSKGNRITSIDIVLDPA